MLIDRMIRISLKHLLEQYYLLKKEKRCACVYMCMSMYMYMYMYIYIYTCDPCPPTHLEYVLVETVNP